MIKEYYIITRTSNGNLRFEPRVNLRMKSEGKIFYITCDGVLVATYGVKNAFRLLQIFYNRRKKEF